MTKYFLMHTIRIFILECIENQVPHLYIFIAGTRKIDLETLTLPLFQKWLLT